MSYLKCEEAAASLVMNLYVSNPTARYPYHNLLHTIKVVSHAKEIAGFYNLNAPDTCSLIIAAWFHDVGHLFGETDDHEERSVIIMNAYLKTMNTDAQAIKLAGNCIMATKSHPHLSSLPEKIICDADTYHFGTGYFRETEFMMKHEMELRNNTIFPQWHGASIELLRNHVFYTEYCQVKLNRGKWENIEWLKSLR